MKLKEGHIYHIYNRSNELIFKSDNNYLYFLGKVKKLITPYSEILSWCLMPNHFHFLLVTNSEGCKLIDEPHRPNVQHLTKNIGTLLSGYTKAFNLQNSRKGKLFSHNTQYKNLNNYLNNHTIMQNCFHYIHQNPVRAGLCENPEEWTYSSVRDYALLRKGSLVNQELAHEIINYDKENFLLQSKIVLDERVKKWLY